MTGSGAGHLGDRVLMDEYVGSRRVRMVGEVIEAVPGERIVWQMRHRGLRLPVWLTLTLVTRGHDVRLRHSISAGWRGRARVLDALWRLYFTPSFARATDRHVRTEFALLRNLLHRGGPHATVASGATSDRPDQEVS
jgi:hypothetical protein